MTVYRLRQKAVLLSLALLILNDHVLKGSVFSGFITGKLSDFAGLFFFPFFVGDCLRIRDRVAFDSICILTALAFTLLKISPAFLRVFEEAYQLFGLKAAVVQDETDLMALPMLALAACFERTLLAKTPIIEETSL